MLSGESWLVIDVKTNWSSWQKTENGMAQENSNCFVVSMKIHFHILKSHSAYAQYTSRAMQTLRASFVFVLVLSVLLISFGVIGETHDDVIKWKYFPCYWPIVRGIHRSPVNSPHKGQWRGALMFSLICARINDWVNNRQPGDLSRHRAHHDVNVMTMENPVSVPVPVKQSWWIWVNSLYEYIKTLSIREKGGQIREISGTEYNASIDYLNN